MKNKKRILNKINLAIRILDEALELAKQEYPDAEYFIDPYCISIIEYDTERFPERDGPRCLRQSKILLSSDVFRVGAGDW